MEKRDIVVKFDHVTKMYKLFKNDKKRLLHTFFKNIKYKEKKAVNDVSFEVERGEAVALFGKNGAGKSTILKMITGVAYPTSGTITVNGRVSALLELTSGFDPEFTGRENIYLKGQLLGLKDTEIRELEQEIIDFAELAEYIDQPVRTYSSGMKARLGFSINVNILINKPLIHIQKIVPGPPRYMAKATPAIAPTPILEDNAKVSDSRELIPVLLLVFIAFNCLIKLN